MKSFKELKESLEKSDGVVFSYGRFQPPTNGHEVLVNNVLDLANENSYDNVIYTSQTEDNNNPLSWDDKVDVLTKMFPEADISRDKIATPFKVLSELSDKGYKNVIMVVGSDRVDEFKSAMTKYTTAFDSFDVVSAGVRNENSNTASGMSGSKLRQFAKDNDFINFNAGLPKSYTEGKKLFQLVRKGLK